VALKWYIVHVYSGFENKVKTNLDDRIASSPHKDKFGKVIVPTEEIVELVKGKRKTSLSRMEAGKLKPQPKFFFESGDEIRVIDGPFTNFNGTVEEVNPEKGKIKVLVSIFGRSTPVELDFVQVTKL
jgi:transcriptional antiterminator NusG